MNVENLHERPVERLLLDGQSRRHLVQMERLDIETAGARPRVGHGGRAAGGNWASGPEIGGVGGAFGLGDGVG
ncbi:hypothetical protein [Streptomyces sp. NPDC058583]|uniref:hypothetical protein n=1 Tax=Streptomyces sp. NPDC058583 TaxID=3346549 RepID=UPI00364F1A4E